MPTKQLFHLPEMLECIEKPQQMKNYKLLGILPINHWFRGQIYMKMNQTKSSFLDDDYWVILEFREDIYSKRYVPHLWNFLRF